MNSLNFSLSTRCPANCVFCPSDRGGSVKDMSIDLVDKLVRELRDSTSTDVRHITSSSLGENGESLMNPDWLRITRLIRHSLPNLHIRLFTNALLLTREVSEAIVQEGLVSVLTTNMDGFDEESYQSVKGIPYQTVKRNILGFLDTRARRGKTSPLLNIQAITRSSYVDAVASVFGKPPVKMSRDAPAPQPDDRYDRIRAEWESAPGWFSKGAYGDLFIPLGQTSNGVSGWAERSMVDPAEDMSRYECPFLFRAENDVFVAPNGDWYVCCMDAKQEGVFGNLCQSTIREVCESDRRRMFLEALRQRRFRDLGPPCNTVKACALLRTRAP